jgi:hypothetical protein
MFHGFLSNERLGGNQSAGVAALACVAAIAGTRI